MMNEIHHLRSTEKSASCLTKKQVDNKKQFKKLYAEVCTSGDTDGVTLFTEKRYNAAINFVSIELSVLRVNPNNYVFNTSARRDFLR